MNEITLPSWKLTEAKARFSELVRKASHDPQRVTVEGKEAVVVVSSELFQSLLPSHKQPNLVELLEHSPLSSEELIFGEDSQPLPTSAPATFS